MTKPFIDIYENEAGSVIILFLHEVKLGEHNEPQVLEMYPHQVESLREALDEFMM